MVTTTIRALPAATLAALTDLIPVDQADGTTRYDTLQQIETLLAPIIGTAARGIVQVAVNSSSQIVVTYNDGSTAVAGTVAGAAVPAAGLVSSNGTAFASEALGPSLTNLNGTLDVASSVTGQVSAAKSEADSALGGASVSNGTLTLTHVALGAPISIPLGLSAVLPKSAPILYTDVNGTSIAGTLTTTVSGSMAVITNPAGAVVTAFAVPAGAQGPAGTLGSGDASANLVEGAGTGPARALSAVLAAGSVSPANFGAQRSNATVASVIAQVTRAGIAAYQAPGGGGHPFAFAANQPFPDGSADYRTHVPPAFGTGLVAIGGTQANPTVDLHAHVTLTAPGYVGSDGHFYLPIPGLHPSIATGQAVSGGVTASDNSTVALASGTTVTSLDLGNFRIGISAQGTHVGTDGNTYSNTTGARAVLTIGSLKVVCRNGSYVDASGNWWIDMPNIGESFILGMVAIGGNIAAGSKVVLTQANCLRITDQPAGTSVPAGTQIDFGADMTRVTQGLFVHTAEGTTALSSIASVTGSVVTLSAPLTSGQSYGNTVPYSGIRSMVRMTFYKPLAPDATLGNVLTMDTLAMLAARYACPYSAAVEPEPGSYTLQNMLCTGGNAAWRFKKGVILNGGTGGVMITDYPQPGSDIYFEHAHIFNSGLQDSAYEIDGTQFTWYVQNTSNGTSGDINYNVTFGQYQDAFRIQNVGNYHWDHNEVFGPGKTQTHGNGVRLSNVVLGTTEANNFHNCPIGINQTGYGEDNQAGRNSYDNCGRGFNQEDASTFNGYCGLIGKWRDGDDDCTNNTAYFKRMLELTVSDCEASASGGKDAYVIAGCNTGMVADIQGGNGGGTGACVHMTSAMQDGSYVGCSEVASHDINVNGWACALQIDAGSNTNPWHDHHWNGTTAGAVIDNGTGNAPAAVSAATSLSSDTYFNGGFSGSLNVPAGTGGVAIPVGIDQDAGNNVSGSGTASFAYACKRSGHYRLRVSEAQFLNTGTAANSSTGAPAAPPAGTDCGILAGFASNANEVVYFPTGPKRNFCPTVEVDIYYNAGNTITVSAFADAATALLFARVEIVQVS